MTIHSFNLFFIWLLPVTAGGALTTPHHNFTDVTTGNVTANQFETSRATTQETSSSNVLIITPSITVPTEVRSKPLLKMAQTQTANPTNSTWSQLKSSPTEVMSTTDGQFQVPKSTTVTVVTNRASNPTSTTIPPASSSFTQSQSTGSTIKGEENTHGSTQLTSTLATSAVTDGDPIKPSSSYRPSPAATKISIIHILSTKKSTTTKSSKGTNHTNAVAGIIGGALVLMMVGFLVIFIKKHRDQKHQMTTTDWAGPTPFLQDGVDTGNVELRSTNHIFMSSFLPQRLSKRLSMFTQTQQELEDMTPGTFGDKHQGDTSFHQVDGCEVKESKETAAPSVLEIKSTEDVAETVPVPSSQTNSQV
uniref:endochitinase A n=1 Tax=Solea senegalensis TaxID=28829 RepID=UPI001CD87927|nr:endochitinase A [Solea senegalensis]XP_043889009.1 endochitinase A [Solea senegalensis]XP_043889010.1 endochitinase A [Solea senegalensis]